MSDSTFPKGELKIGDTLFDKYKIEEVLGKGAFATVYRVRHLRLNVDRALKVLRRDHEGVGSTEIRDYRARFELEAELTARVHQNGAHPHVIQVFDFNKDEENNLLAHEIDYARGGSLAALIRRAQKDNTPISIDEAVRLTHEAAGGLAALHTLDIVHRDVKPSNILIGADGKAKIADLGLAQTPQSRFSRGSASPDHPGTPEYMPPEQQPGQKAALRHNADVYALGCVLFELLTGRMYYHQKPGTRAKHLRADVPTWLDELTARMLENDAAKRFWDGSEVATVLKDKIALRKLEQAGQRELQEQKKIRERSHRQAEKRRREFLERFWQLFKKLALVTIVLGILIAFAFGTTQWINAANVNATQTVIALALTPLIIPTASELVVSPTFTPSLTAILPTHTSLPTNTRVVFTSTFLPSLSTPIPTSTRQLPISTSLPPTLTPTNTRQSSTSTSVYNLLNLGGKIAFERNGWIYKMNPDGSDLTSLAVGSKPSWSSDATKIAFDRNQQIFIMDADGSGVRQITQERYGATEPDWSPRGDKIVYCAVASDGSTQLNIVELAGGTSTTLTQGSLWTCSPDWSPNGEKIVFNRNVDTERHSEIFVIGSDGRSMNQLTHLRSFSYHPQWSPDGKTIAFVSGDVIIMNADRLDLTYLGTGVLAWNPAWSPDGKYVVFNSSSLSTYDRLYITLVNGLAKPIAITQSSFNDIWVDWSRR